MQDDRADPGGMAEEYSGRVKIGKASIDEHQGLATEYGVARSPRCCCFIGARWRTGWSASAASAISKPASTAWRGKSPVIITPGQLS
jgi:hypothetical protein